MMDILRNDTMDSINDDSSLGRRLAAKQQAFLKGFLHGEECCDAKRLKKAFGEFGIRYPNNLTVVAIAVIDEMCRHKSKYSQQQWEIIFNSIIDISETIVNETLGGIVIPQGSDRFTLLLNPRELYSYMRLYTEINDCITRLRNAFSAEYNITACYFLSGIIENATLIPAAYKAANALIDERIYRGFDQIITEKPTLTAADSNESCFIDFHDEHNIKKCIKAMDIEGLSHYICDIFDDRKKRRLDFDRSQILLAELLHLLNRELRDNNLDIMQIYTSYNKIFENIQYMTLDEMKQCALEYYRSALDAIKNAGYHMDCHVVTNRTCMYINQYYTKDISLYDIAAAVGVTPSYLSRVFRKDKNQTVVEYLNKTRIEHAKNLIRDSNVNFKKIPGYVGFNSMTYFFTVFKQYAGETPSQYKKHLAINM